MLSSVRTQPWRSVETLDHCQLQLTMPTKKTKAVAVAAAPMQLQPETTKVGLGNVDDAAKPRMQLDPRYVHCPFTHLSVSASFVIGLPCKCCKPRMCCVADLDCPAIGCGLLQPR